ncbi:DUF2252 family protein [Jiella sonneratiae]|uniref:DUF2252 family protein n=1 Tax=Jiella sonneratiae TaxID=2816856 RepID=A0ABS3J9W4_9HYPH|nr:DUF2252 family protein [Jiella sonneratiae]MBO0906459.1 DUF2252 family protein [Jiella sonneratiae]
MAGFASSMQRFEDWLAEALKGELVVEDLDCKHEKMAKSPFAFLRATYWRFAETILDVCPDLAAAPPLLAVGDTHLENFGTWRDAEGRLIWGVNDFDEAAVMPYALDLVRLAASALLGRGADAAPGSSAVARAILSGYRRALEAPQPIVLERDHKWLRKAVMLPEGERRSFWEKMEAIEPGRQPVPQRFVAALGRALPAGATEVVIGRRTGAGLGSLGRPRFVARATWCGGPVVREAKAVLPSAWTLCHGPKDAEIRIGEIAAGRGRAADPHYRVDGGVVLRRLSPNSRKLDVKSAVAELLSLRMLELMGAEVGNCHAAGPVEIGAVRADLAARPQDWLRRAAKDAARLVAEEHAAFA